MPTGMSREDPEVPGANEDCTFVVSSSWERPFCFLKRHLGFSRCTHGWLLANPLNHRQVLPGALTPGASTQLFTLMGLGGTLPASCLPLHLDFPDYLQMLAYGGGWEAPPSGSQDLAGHSTARMPRSLQKCVLAFVAPLGSQQTMTCLDSSAPGWDSPLPRTPPSAYPRLVEEGWVAPRVGREGDGRRKKQGQPGAGPSCPQWSPWKPEHKSSPRASVDAQAQAQAGEGHSALKRTLHKVKLQKPLISKP